MGSPQPKTASPADAGTVLVVEDDDATRAFLLDNLAADGLLIAFRVVVPHSPSRGSLHAGGSNLLTRRSPRARLLPSVEEQHS
jgi:hypothetical protein